MKRHHRLLAFGLALLLLACVVAAYLTRGAAIPAGPKPATAAGPASPVNQHLLQTADRLSAQADIADEEALARDAVQLADRELDQAFASALREAELPSATPLNSQLKALADRVAKWTAQVAADQDRINKLPKTTAGSGKAADQLEVAKAQLALDQDELADAQQDLTQQGGDEHANLQRAFEQYEASQQVARPPRSASLPPTDTLLEQGRAWLSLQERRRDVQLAGAEAAAHAANLQKQHDALEAFASHKPVAPSGAAPADASADTATDPNEEDTATAIARLQRLSDQKKSMADLDQRIQDSHHLAEGYAQWSSLLATRQRAVLHLVLRSLAAVLAILLATVLIDGLIYRFFRKHAQPRRVHHLRLMTTVGIQLIAVSLIVLVIFGPPNQLSTMIGLATAGLTVALRDFIVAFFGWFALMGRNGIRVGDWVEIRGVSGEVVEIGLLKTIVLEMGDWGSTGSPTGRKVAFVNSFAIEDHYFNFSTAGQWFWDELQVSLPTTADPYRLSLRIRELVQQATENDAREAEADWKRATRDENARPFSAKPLVDLRPSVNGLDVVVRYITQAPKRYEVKSRLLESIVDLMHKPGSAPVPAEEVPAPRRF